MTVTLQHPEALEIWEDDAGTRFFGGDQEWFARHRSRLDGCGPTSAANLTAYLAHTRPALRSLYGGEDMRRTQFASHMEEMYSFVTPGNMGINRVEMFVDGMDAFFKHRALPLTPHVFPVYSALRRNRPPVSELKGFVQKGIAEDCPIAFLNLSRGREQKLQNWHWITLVSAEEQDGKLIACASDEGKHICFDLGLWYLSTVMQGGLVYYSDPPMHARSN